jgi:hypothetical protein
MRGGVHICARALLDIKWIWFGYIARYPSGGGGVYFTRTNNFYLSSLRLEEGVGGQHPVPPSLSPTASVLPPSLALLYQYQIHSKLVSFTQQFNKILPPSQIVMFELLWLSSKAYLKIFLSLLSYLSSTSGAVCNFIMFIFENRRQNKRITIKDEIVYICNTLI